MDIFEFQGAHRWLSNFWPALAVLDGVTYPSVEHAYQAAKFPHDERKPFTDGSPGRAKRMGSAALLTQSWFDNRLILMSGLLAQKFQAGSQLAAKLKATAPGRIVETNVWGDTYWGVCRGVGCNHLGNLLMARRDELLNELLS